MKWPWVLVHVACVVALVTQLGSVLEGYIAPTLTNTVVEQGAEGHGLSYNSQYLCSARVQWDSSGRGWLRDQTHSHVGLLLRPEQAQLVTVRLGRANQHLRGAEQCGGGAEEGVQTDQGVCLQEDLHANQKFWNSWNEKRWHVHVNRMNFPHDCFTLDIANNTDVKEKEIKRLTIWFQDMPNITGIDRNIPGGSLSCNRNLRDQTFYASGQRIQLTEMRKKYAVKIKQNVFVEEDFTKNCRKYPNVEFLSYKNGCWN